MILSSCFLTCCRTVSDLLTRFLLSCFCFSDICHTNLDSLECKSDQSIKFIYILAYHYPAVIHIATHCADLQVVHVHCCAFHTAIRVLLLCALFSLSLSLAWRDPGFCINRSDRVLVCHYSNTLAISRALLPSLESVPSIFLCCNRKMRPSPRVQLDFEFSLLLLLAGDVSLNRGPGVRGLRLGTVNARSTRIRLLLYLTLLPARALTS